MKVHVARDALHANMLGLSEPITGDIILEFKENTSAIRDSSDDMYCTVETCS